MARGIPHVLQMVLDLFEPSPPSPPAPRTEGPAIPAEPLTQVLPAAQLSHPRATRRITLGHAQVAYAFARSRRRTIGMLVGPEGLEVRAPRWVSVAEVESALREKADWIVRKLQESFERQTQLGATRIQWQDGCEVPYLGQPLRVVLDSSPLLQRGSAQLEAEVLRIGLPQSADAVQIREAVQAWLMTRARALFTERLNHYAPLLGVQWQKLSLSSASTRWGSAGRGRDGVAAIRLNWRLIHHKREVIDYVVAHELSHLRVMDHSPRFWETVGSVMPDYAERRRVLRDEPLPPWP